MFLHGFVQGGTNRYAGKFVKVVGKADEDPTVQVMADEAEFAADALNGAVVKILVGRPNW